jgi:hypothetical protein
MSDSKDKSGEQPLVVEARGAIDTARIGIIERAVINMRSDTMDDVGCHVSDGADGSVSRATRNDDGSFSRTMQGPPARGEADTMPAVLRLIQFLNKRGANWSNPVLVDPDETSTDAIATDGDNTLRVQHVRADTDSAIYEALAKHGVSNAHLATEELAACLGRAIAHKVTAIPHPGTRASLVLVLDASRLPDLCMSDGKAAALRILPKVCAESGFQQIYVVGPLAEMTYQLWPAE